MFEVGTSKQTFFFTNIIGSMAVEIDKALYFKDTKIAFPAKEKSNNMGNARPLLLAFTLIHSN